MEEKLYNMAEWYWARGRALQKEGNPHEGLLLVDVAYDIWTLLEGKGETHATRFENEREGYKVWSNA